MENFRQLSTSKGWKSNDPSKTESKVEFLILQLNRMKKLSGVGDRSTYLIYRARRL